MYLILTFCFLKKKFDFLLVVKHMTRVQPKKLDMPSTHRLSPY